MQTARQFVFDQIAKACSTVIYEPFSTPLRILCERQFVSLSGQVDTSTPTGKMVFTVLGAVAELERNLIVERVRAGLRHARSKGKRLGRPRKPVDAREIHSLRGLRGHPNPAIGSAENWP
jgi:hypothetical protein